MRLALVEGAADELDASGEDEGEEHEDDGSFDQRLSGHGPPVSPRRDACAEAFATKGNQE